MDQVYTYRLRPDNPSWPESTNQQEEFYLLLDKNMEPIEWGLFDDSELEGPPQYFSGVNGYNIYELPSGEIVFSTYYHQQGIYNNEIHPGKRALGIVSGSIG